MVKWFSSLTLLTFTTLGLAGATRPHAGEKLPTPAAGAISCEAGERDRSDLLRADSLRADPLRVETVRLENGRYLADRESGAIAELTLDPRLQAVTERLLQRGQIEYGASVVLSIPDGRVLAMAGRSASDTDTPASGTELALRSWAPAASIFKLVSAASLVEEAGLTSASRACYHGGTSSVRRDNLVDYPRLDRCASLAYGVGKSQNAILAKLAVRNLSPEQLTRTGHALGFGEQMEFDLPVEPSHLDVPESDPLEFARTAAGFWHSTLSAMHGAVLAAEIADGGRMVTPYLVDRARASVAIAASGGDVPNGDALDGDTLAPAPIARQVLSPGAAAEVADMMAGVIRMGTARGAFHDRWGRPRLPFSAAGKTGTLYGTLYGKAVGYSWFVGFAPVEHPTVAFAVALANKPGRRLRAADVARELLAEYAASSDVTLTVAPAPRASKRRHAIRAKV